MKTKTIAIELAANEVVEIQLVRKKTDETLVAHKPKRPEKRFCSIDWLVKYTGFPKNSIYQKTSKNEIPHIKRGRKLFFEKSQIDKWLEEGRVKTKGEIAAEAEAFLSNRGRRMK